MKKVLILFSFLTVFTVVSVSASNMPVPNTYSFTNVKVKSSQEVKLPNGKVDNSCTATTTCANGTTCSYTAPTCAEARAVVIAWLKNGGCQR